MGILSWFRGPERKANVPLRVVDTDFGLQDTSTGKHIPLRDSIAYDHELIGKLLNDHRGLVNIFTQIKAAALNGEFSRLPGLLGNFRINLQAHVMLENVRFYVYVQQKAANDAETSAFIAEVRKEMDGIARAVVKFAHRHAANAPSEHTVAQFLEELEGIGWALLKRVEFEERRLYILYQEA